MQLTDSSPRRYGAVQKAKILERVGGYYECQEVPFGVVYRWHPGYLLLECGCGARQALTWFAATAVSVIPTTPALSEKSWLASVWRTRLFILGTMLGTAKGLGYLVKPFLAVQAYCQVPCQVR